jgi:hypothetical protein
MTCNRRIILAYRRSQTRKLLANFNCFIYCLGIPWQNSIKSPDEAVNNTFNFLGAFEPMAP